MKANYHTHTVFCDGKNTPEEIILAAIEKGFSFALVVLFTQNTHVDAPQILC